MFDIILSIALTTAVFVGVALLAALGVIFVIYVATTHRHDD